jgi:hypothetical protein
MMDAIYVNVVVVGHRGVDLGSLVSLQVVSLIKPTIQPTKGFRGDKRAYRLVFNSWELEEVSSKCIVIYWQKMNKHCRKRSLDPHIYHGGCSVLTLSADLEYMPVADIYPLGLIET